MWISTGKDEGKWLHLSNHSIFTMVFWADLWGLHCFSSALSLQVRYKKFELISLRFGLRQLFPAATSSLFSPHWTRSSQWNSSFQASKPQLFGCCCCSVAFLIKLFNRITKPQLNKGRYVGGEGCMVCIVMSVWLFRPVQPERRVKTVCLLVNVRKHTHTHHLCSGSMSAPGVQRLLHYSNSKSPNNTLVKLVITRHNRHK